MVGGLWAADWLWKWGLVGCGLWGWGFVGCGQRISFRVWQQVTRCPPTTNHQPHPTNLQPPTISFLLEPSCVGYADGELGFVVVLASEYAVGVFAFHYYLLDGIPVYTGRYLVAAAPSERCRPVYPCHGVVIVVAAV